MPTTINGTTGVSQVQDGTITSAKIVDGAVAQTDLDATNKLAQCKAWVNFDGTLTGTITPRANFGITSVTKNGTGDYTLNITGGILADANYIMLGSARYNGSGSVAWVVEHNTVTKTTTALRIRVDNTTAAQDSSVVAVALFGN